jgi:hypothetical protein
VAENHLANGKRACLSSGGIYAFTDSNGFMRHFKALRLGMIGFTAAALINGVAFYLMEKPSARCFSDEWWVAWFPGYAVWVVVLIVGVGQQFQWKK